MHYLEIAVSIVFEDRPVATIQNAINRAVVERELAFYLAPLRGNLPIELKLAETDDLSSRVIRQLDLIDFSAGRLKGFGRGPAENPFVLAIDDQTALGDCTVIGSQDGDRGLCNRRGLN